MTRPTRLGDDADSTAAYLLDPGRAISERSRWERVFTSELTQTFETDPHVLTAALLPPRVTQRAVAALEKVATLPRWASEFVRRKQFVAPTDPGRPADTQPPTARDIAEALAPTLATAAYAQHVLTLLAGRGIEYKQWVTRHDPKVRATHADVDGTVVRLSAPFVVGGALMMHPADSRTAPIAQWINDRCVLIGRPSPPNPL